MKPDEIHQDRKEMAHSLVNTVMQEELLHITLKYNSQYFKG